MQVTFSLLLILALACSPGAPRGAAAQSPDSLVRLLDAAAWQVRSRAIHRLNRLPIADLPPTFAAKAIAVLEREALQPDPQAGPPGDGYGEYLIELVRGVLRLRDQRSLRSMALLGVATSREAQEFVAAQGGASLPFLEEAYRVEDRRSVVVETWAYMVGPFGDRLSRSERLGLMTQLFGVIRDDALGFTFAAKIASLVEAVPLLEDLAASHSSEHVRESAAEVLPQLRRARDALSPLEVLTRLSDWLEALCRGAEAARLGACQSLGNLLADATEHVRAGRTGPAKEVLSTFANRADSAFQQGALTDAEYRLLAEDARYLVARL